MERGLYHNLEKAVHSSPSLPAETNGTLTPEYLQFYKDLHEGRFANKQVIDKDLRTNTPEILAISDKISELQQQFDTTTNQHMRRVYNEQIAGLQQELNGLRGDMQEQVAYRDGGQMTSRIKQSELTIQDVASGRRIEGTIGSLPNELVDIGYGSDIMLHKRIAAYKPKASGDVPIQSSSKQLARAVNDYKNSTVISFKKNGKEHLNIIRKNGDGTATLVALQAQNDRNFTVTYFNKNTSSNYINRIIKNKTARVLFQDASSAHLASLQASKERSRPTGTLAQDDNIVKDKRFRPEAAGSYFETRMEAHRQNVDKVTKQPRLQKKVKQLVLSS